MPGSASGTSRHGPQRAAAQAERRRKGKRAREDHSCEMCGVKGLERNEFTDKSPHAPHEHI
eukprot:306438-Pyramimonas_sp.AAC.1